MRNFIKSFFAIPFVQAFCGALWCLGLLAGIVMLLMLSNRTIEPTPVGLWFLGLLITYWPVHKTLLYPLLFAPRLPTVREQLDEIKRNIQKE
jgi:hypothetical protein